MPATEFNFSSNLEGESFFPFIPQGSLFLKLIVIKVGLLGAFSGEVVLWNINSGADDHEGHFTTFSMGSTTNTFDMNVSTMRGTIDTPKGNVSLPDGNHDNNERRIDVHPLSYNFGGFTSFTNILADDINMLQEDGDDDSDKEKLDEICDDVLSDHGDSDVDIVYDDNEAGKP